ncbi:MAG: prepilin peptidase [Xanthomonadaceae bacterium]|nr:prepilin peptidase [Xanthomonadaceae bacterium]MDE1958916.1 prepilin peptidase [Xanthomonadaceae bacterium]MDE2178858.1 prepilin peptidase [Xanthomonadaceae bacterium]MDE2245967.1 prepilin peptidase [Xanthomonadaceae bacterium]
MSFITQLSPAALIAFVGVLGLLVGSFLNVVILRLPARLEHTWRSEAREMLELAADDRAAPPPGLVREPSHCPQCRHVLAARDNMPLLSWLLLRGRCRYCRAPISIQYPLVELATALLSAAIAWRFGPGTQTLAGLALTWALVALTGIDLRTQLLPDSITLPLLWLGLLLALGHVFLGAAQSILGAALGYLSLWSVYWLFKLATGKEGMGYGDFKLLAALGAWMGAGALLPIVLLSSLVGAVVGSAMLVLRGRDRSIPIAFGPYLAAAGWIWFVAGDTLLHAYLTLFVH